MIAVKIANVILPVFIVIAVGFLFGKFGHIDTKTPSTLTLYIFSPALFFNSIVKSTLDLWELGKILVFGIVVFAVFALLVTLLARLLGFDKQNKNALMLASGFPNAGNYALPLILFAFGEPGMAVGVIYMSIQSFIINSAGVFFASQAQQGFKEALLNIFRVPGFLAIGLGLAIRLVGIHIPAVLGRPIELLGSASIPTILILLGVSLSQVKINSAVKFVSVAAVLKLLAYPLVALLVMGIFFPPHSLEAKVLLVSTATPTAATTAILAMKYNAKPELVSSTMLVTTILSLITVSAVLALTI